MHERVTNADEGAAKRAEGAVKPALNTKHQTGRISWRMYKNRKEAVLRKVKGESIIEPKYIKRCLRTTGEVGDPGHVADEHARLAQADGDAAEEPSFLLSLFRFLPSAGRHQFQKHHNRQTCKKTVEKAKAGELEPGTVVIIEDYADEYAHSTPIHLHNTALIQPTIGRYKS